MQATLILGAALIITILVALWTAFRSMRKVGELTEDRDKWRGLAGHYKARIDSLSAPLALDRDEQLARLRKASAEAGHPMPDDDAGGD